MKTPTLTIMLAALSLALTNCNTIKSFIQSEEGQVIVESGGALLIQTSLTSEPDLEPVFVGLADAIELKRINLDDLKSVEEIEDPVFDGVDDRVTSGVLQAIGSVIAYYSNRGSVTAQLVSATIRAGVSDYRKGSK